MRSGMFRSTTQLIHYSSVCYRASLFIGPFTFFPQPSTWFWPQPAGQTLHLPGQLGKTLGHSWDQHDSGHTRGLQQTSHILEISFGHCRESRRAHPLRVHLLSSLVWHLFSLPHLFPFLFIYCLWSFTSDETWPYSSTSKWDSYPIRVVHALLVCIHSHITSIPRSDFLVPPPWSQQPSYLVLSPLVDVLTSVVHFFHPTNEPQWLLKCKSD